MRGLRQDVLEAIRRLSSQLINECTGRKRSHLGPQHFPFSPEWSVTRPPVMLTPQTSWLKWPF